MTTQERAVELAEDLGHTVEWDPPFASSVRRWTCSVCGKAVLDSGSVICGSASTDRCVKPRSQMSGLELLRESADNYPWATP